MELWLIAITLGALIFVAHVGVEFYYHIKEKQP